MKACEFTECEAWLVNRLADKQQHELFMLNGFLADRWELEQEQEAQRAKLLQAIAYRKRQRRDIEKLRQANDVIKQAENYVFFG